MAEDCDRKVEQFTLSVTAGTYKSDVYTGGNNFDRGYAIRSLLEKILPPGTKVCGASYSEGNMTCLPKSLKISIPRDKGRFRKRVVEEEDDEVFDLFYELTMTVESDVRIKVKCHCTPYPD